MMDFRNPNGKSADKFILGLINANIMVGLVDNEP